MAEEFYDREEEEYPELTLDDPNTINMYKTAADISNQALERVLAAVVPGASVLALCRLGDAALVEISSRFYSKKKDIIKGIAHPTTVMVNNVVNHFSPLTTDDVIIKEGDMVKVLLGAHIHGLCSVVGQTVVCLASKETPIIDRQADVLCAAHFVSEAVLRMLRPGVKNTEIQDMIRRVAAQFDCAPVEGQVSYEGCQWSLEGSQVIPNALTADQRVDTFEISENTVFHISVYISTEDGRAKLSDKKTTIYKRDPHRQYNLKLKTAREAFNTIIQEYSDFSFSLRQLDDLNPRLRLGITEMAKHDVVVGYPVEEERNSGAAVAQVSFTALVLPNQTQRLLKVVQPNIVSSSKSIQDEEIKALLATEVEKKKKK
ncbi:hypothetical protein RCL1_002076 [Eukaryota sp. TZLM3-RCL]